MFVGYVNDEINVGGHWFYTVIELYDYNMIYTLFLLLPTSKLTIIMTVLNSGSVNIIMYINKRMHIERVRGGKEESGSS